MEVLSPISHKKLRLGEGTDKIQHFGFPCSLKITTIYVKRSNVDPAGIRQTIALSVNLAVNGIS